MKNNKFLTFICIICYIVIIGLSSFYLIFPGTKKLEEANSIKELTYEEKTKLIDEINDKYIKLENEVKEKYVPKTSEINDKYNKLELEIKNKYDTLEKEINNKINDNNVLRNKEFFANGLSKKYYELSDIGSKLNDEKFELGSKEKDEIRENSSKKNSELRSVEENKSNELNRLNNSKENEIYEVNNRKTNKSIVKAEGVRKILVGSIIILIPFIYIIVVFNKLTRLLNSVKEKWSQVDVYLKQRADLIPNIVETIKGYTTHEKSTLTKITQARNNVVNASSKEDEINANNKLDNVVSRLFVLQEDYPELKADANFMNLQHNLNDIEDNISVSRGEYNKAVLKYKNKLEMFPSNVVACLFKFKPELFFEIKNDEKENVNIEF